MFDLSSACYEVMFFVILLRCFLFMMAIQIGKADSISRRYQIIIVSTLKKMSSRYSSHIIIKFIGFYLFIMLLVWKIFRPV